MEGSARDTLGDVQTRLGAEEYQRGLTREQQLTFSPEYMDQINLPTDDRERGYEEDSSEEFTGPVELQDVEENEDVPEGYTDYEENEWYEQDESTRAEDGPALESMGLDPMKWITTSDGD